MNLECAVCKRKIIVVNDDTFIDKMSNKVTDCGDCCYPNCKASDEANGTILCSRHHLYVKGYGRYKVPVSMCLAHAEVLSNNYKILRPDYWKTDIPRRKK